jgi:peroxiredoxin Q/BCP
MNNIKIGVMVTIMCMSMLNLRALSVGNMAPDFSLPDQDNKIHTLSEFKGKYVVLYFYPKDGTPGCTKQACQLRDNFNEFEKQDIVVLGVNYDSPQTHKEFKEKHHLPFTLLSDAHKSVAKKYGAKNWWFVPVPYRKTFVIDPQGMICSILPHVDVSSHANEVLKIVEQHRQR